MVVILLARILTAPRASNRDMGCFGVSVGVTVLGFKA